MLEFNYRQVVFKLHKEERMPWTRYITQTTILSFYLCSLLSNKPKNFTNFRMTYESAAICSKNKVDEVKVSSSIKAFEANNFHSILWLLTIYSTLVNTGPTTYNNFLVSCEQYVRSRAQIEILEMNHLFVWGPQAFGRTAHLGGSEGCQAWPLPGPLTGPSPWLPVSVVQDQDFPHSAKVGNFSELVGGPEG